MFQHQQSTPYSNYDLEMANAWAAIQETCALPSYPTATPTLVTNVTNRNYAPPGYPTASCVSELTYTVVSGDNCEAIAEKCQVSTGGLIALNSIRVVGYSFLDFKNICEREGCDIATGFLLIAAAFIGLHKHLCWPGKRFAHFSC